MFTKNGVRIIRMLKGFWGVPFPFFDETGGLVGKDRSIGKNVETFEDAIENIEREIVNETNPAYEDNEEDDISVTQSTTHSSSKRLKKQHKERKYKHALWNCGKCMVSYRGTRARTRRKK